MYQMSTTTQIEHLNYTLLCCESPFSWTLPDEANLDGFLIGLLDRCDFIEETSKFRLKSFSRRLILGFELWDKFGDIVSAKYQIQLCCNQLKQLIRTLSSEQMASTIYSALWHVTLTCKAWLFFYSGDTIKAAKIIETVSPVQDMNKAEQAGIYGIKASLFSQYKSAGVRLALDYAIIAQDLDPSQPEWHYLIAYCLGKMRRDHDRVSQLEMDEMECASRLQLHTDANYTVRLALVYADAARFLHNNADLCHNRQEELETCAKYSKAAILKFKEALLCSGPRNYGLKAKVAHGLISLPVKGDVETSVTKALLMEVVQMMPKNSSVCLDFGKFYDQLGGDAVKAQRYLLKAHDLGNYEAFIYLLNLRWKQSTRSGHLIKEITEAMDRYKLEPQLAELFVYLGVTHLLINDDWKAAVSCFVKSLTLDPVATYLERFCGFNSKGKSYNLLEIVTNELRIKSNEECVYKNILHVFLEKVITINQKLFLHPPITGMFATFKELQMEDNLNLMPTSSTWKN